MARKKTGDDTVYEADIAVAEESSAPKKASRKRTAKINNDPVGEVNGAAAIDGDNARDADDSAPTATDIVVNDDGDDVEATGGDELAATDTDDVEATADEETPSIDSKGVAATVVEDDSTDEDAPAKRLTLKKTRKPRVRKNGNELFASVPDADEISRLTPIFDIEESLSEEIEEEAISALPHAELDPELMAYDPDEIEDTHESAEESARYEAFLANYKEVMADVLKSAKGSVRAGGADLELDELVIIEDDDEDDELIYDEDEPVSEEEWESISRSMSREDAVAIDSEALFPDAEAEEAETGEESEVAEKTESAEATEESEAAETDEDNGAVRATEDTEAAEVTEGAEAAEVIVDSEAQEDTKEIETVEESESAEIIEESESAEVIGDNEVQEGIEASEVAESTEESEAKEKSDDGLLNYQRDVDAIDLMTTADIWPERETEYTEEVTEEVDEEIPDEISEDDSEDYEDAEQFEMDLGVESAPVRKEKRKKYDPESPRLIDNVFETVELIVFTFIAVMVITSFFFRHSVIDGGSMEKTLFDGDVVIISDFLYTPNRGDIVVFEDSGVSGESALVKRIIGIEGDTVRIDEGGTVYVNGEPLIEKYVYTNYPHRYNAGEWKVGKGEVFVLGDHRNVSRDSEDFGPVKADGIIGRVLFRLYPFDSFGGVD